MVSIAQRKKEILQLLSDIEKYPSTSPFKHEMMAFAYVSVCGSIEFMTENIIKEWLRTTIRHHKNSKRYRGKGYISNFLKSQADAREKNIADFNSTKLENIRSLIGQVAGIDAKSKFNDLLKNSKVIQPDIDARLERISRSRHDLAHGQKMPNDMRPNIMELREDFNFVYKHIIQNIIRCLPRC